MANGKNTVDETEFSKIRSFLWPIHRSELFKFIPMLILFFLISFNYHLLRIAKDALIITAPQSGAETIPFLKVWAILPTAIALTFFFTHLSNRFNRENIFYVIMGVFLGFFALFILVLYPYRENFHLHSLADTLQGILPQGAKGFIAIIRYWSFSLFYVMAESWSNIMLSLLLWGFANDVTSVKEARRFYALFGIGINSSGILAGRIDVILQKAINSKALYHSRLLTYLGGDNLWDKTLILFVVLILLCGIAAVIIYRLLHLTIFTERKNLFAASDDQPSTKVKAKMSIRANLAYIAKSKYLIFIAAIVLSYNFVIASTEVLWKSQMKELFPSPGDYTHYMSQVTFYVGILATLGSFFVSGNLIRRCGWRVAALATPAIIMVTGVGFFYFLFLKQYSPGANSAIAILGMTPLALTVFFGSLQNCLSRAAKYTVYDDTKEMAFIPLSPEARLKGKAAIDGIGSRLGKSGSSLLMQGLLMIFATPSACVPFIAGIICVVVPGWMMSVNGLAKRFTAMTSEEQKVKKEESSVAQGAA
ncbi:MAG: Npt1/Npt2 family nucleotide transporter [Chlamydiota bacterium]